MAVKYGSAHIRPGGSITLTNGVAGLRPRKGWTLAASICGAMEALTRALAVELAPIRVNAVCPGVVRTELWSEMTESDREAMYRNLPGRDFRSVVSASRGSRPNLPLSDAGRLQHRPGDRRRWRRRAGLSVETPVPEARGSRPATVPGIKAENARFHFHRCDAMAALAANGGVCARAGRLTSQRPRPISTPPTPCGQERRAPSSAAAISTVKSGTRNR